MKITHISPHLHPAPPSPSPQHQSTFKKKNSTKKSTQRKTETTPTALTLTPCLLTDQRVRQRPLQCVGTWTGGCRFYAAAWWYSSASLFHLCPTKSLREKKKSCKTHSASLKTQKNVVVFFFFPFTLFLKPNFCWVIFCGARYKISKRSLPSPCPVIMVFTLIRPI